MTLGRDHARRSYSYLVALAALFAALLSANRAFALPPKQLAFLVEPTDTTAGTLADYELHRRHRGQERTEVAGGEYHGVAAGLGGDALSTLTVATDATGAAVFDTVTLTAAGKYRLTAAATGLKSANSIAFNVTAGAATSVVFVTAAHTDSSAGSAIRYLPQVAEEDAYKASPSADTITLSLGTSPSGDTLRQGQRDDDQDLHLQQRLSRSAFDGVRDPRDLQRRLAAHRDQRQLQHRRRRAGKAEGRGRQRSEGDRRVRCCRRRSRSSPRTRSERDSNRRRLGPSSPGAARFRPARPPPPRTARPR